MGTDLRDRMAAAVPAAMRRRDHVALAALRSTLAAIDNAAAVPAQPTGHHVGLGAAEVDRRTLGTLELTALVAAEATEREEAAQRYRRHGDERRAARLRQEAEIIRAFLP